MTTSTAQKIDFSEAAADFSGSVFPLRLADQNTIRSTMVMLAQSDLPLAHRLRLMVEFAACLSGTASEFGVPSLEVTDAVTDFQKEGLREQFSVRLSKEMRQGGDGVSVLAQLVQMRLADDPRWGVDEDFRKAWLRGPAQRLGSCEEQLRDPESAWRKFRAHAEALDAVIPGRFERFSARFAENYWSRCRWQSGETLMTHTQRLLVLLAAVRFGVATDPEVVAARSEGREMLTARFDTAARRVTWATFRAFDQHPSFQIIVDSLDPVGGLTETRSLCQV